MGYWYHSGIRALVRGGVDAQKKGKEEEKEKKRGEEIERGLSLHFLLD